MNIFRFFPKHVPSSLLGIGLLFYVNHTKIFILTLIKLAANQAKRSKLKQRSLIKIWCFRSAKHVKFREE